MSGARESEIRRVAFSTNIPADGMYLTTFDSMQAMQPSMHGADIVLEAIALRPNKANLSQSAPLTLPIFAAVSSIEAGGMHTAHSRVFFKALNE